MYDPDTLGIIYDNKGKVADMEYIIKLAKKRKLKKFNEEFSSTQDNYMQDTDMFSTLMPMEPSMEMFPKEERYFLSDLFMITMDGNFLQKGLDGERGLFTKNEIFETYKVMANYIRKIPLNNNTVLDGRIIIGDYFPFAGIFISIPRDNIKDLYPIIENIRVKIDDSNITDLWLNGEIIDKIEFSNIYINLSFAVENISLLTSHLIIVKGLEGLINKTKDAKLLTVHYYSFANADFDKKHNFSEFIRYGYGKERK